MQLIAAGRAHDAGGFWISVERFDELNAVRAAIHDAAHARAPAQDVDAGRRRARADPRPHGSAGADDGRGLADSLGLRETSPVDGALLALEGEGEAAARPVHAGRRRPLEWCDRRLLARIHRYTLNRLRAEIEPVSAADFMRFLLHWQHVGAGRAGCRASRASPAVIEQLDGFEVRRERVGAATCCAARVQDYEPELHRSAVPVRARRLGTADADERLRRKAPLKSSPIALMPREHAALWRIAADAGASELGIRRARRLRRAANARRVVLP